MERPRSAAAERGASRVKKGLLGLAVIGLGYGGYAGYKHFSEDDSSDVGELVASFVKKLTDPKSEVDPVAPSVGVSVKAPAALKVEKPVITHVAAARETPKPVSVVNEFHWVKVDASKVGTFAGENQINYGPDQDQDRKIMEQGACAAFTITCQNGLMTGSSFYSLPNVCPGIWGDNQSQKSSYPNSLETETGRIEPYSSYAPLYPSITPHPYVICSKEPHSEEVTAYRKFLSLEK